MFIIKIPKIGSKETKGSRDSGNEIINEMKSINSNEFGRLIDTSLVDLEEIHLDNDNEDYANELIYMNSLKTFETKPKTTFLGGDHSLSYSTTKAFFDCCRNSGKDSCLLVFDSRVNSGPIDESGFPKHNNWLRKIVDSGFSGEKILLIGARNLNREESSFVKENKIKIISMNQFFDDFQETCDIITEFAGKRETYASIDMSVVDPAFAKSSIFNEQGGFTSRQMIYLVQRINKLKNLRAVDLVDIDSERDKDHGNITVKLGAKIVSEFF